jgi:hypothetical protein
LCVLEPSICTACPRSKDPTKGLQIECSATTEDEFRCLNRACGWEGHHSVYATPAALRE